MLRKLVLFRNEIFAVRELSLPFLMELQLDNNHLQDLSGLGCLPCLEVLSARGNQVQQLVAPGQVVNLASLRRLDLSQNSLHGFQRVVELLRHTPQLRELDLRENPFAETDSHVLQEFFDYYLTQRLRRNLAVLSGQEVSLSRIKYLDEKFRLVVEFAEEGRRGAAAWAQNFGYCMSSYGLLSKEYEFLNLVQRSFQYLPKNFFGVHYSLTREFSRYKNRRIGESCVQLAGGQARAEYLNEGNVFWLKQRYDRRLRESRLALRRLVQKRVAALRRRRRHFLEHLPSLVRIQSLIRGVLQRRTLDLREHLARLRFESKAAFAIKIQRRWRSIRMKRRAMEIMKGDQYKIRDEFDDSDLSDGDTNWVNEIQDIDQQYGIKINPALFSTFG